MVILRREIYQQGTGQLLEVEFIERVGGNPNFRRERPPGNEVENRAAAAGETASLAKAENLRTLKDDWDAFLDGVNALAVGNPARVPLLALSRALDERFKFRDILP